MSEKTKQQASDPKPPAEQKPIEEWRDAQGTSRTVFVGLLAANGWAEGYECTQTEYEKAVESFLKKPVRPDKKGE